MRAVQRHFAFDLKQRGVVVLAAADQRQSALIQNFLIGRRDRDSSADINFIQSLILRCLRRFRQRPGYLVVFAGMEGFVGC